MDTPVRWTAESPDSSVGDPCTVTDRPKYRLFHGDAVDWLRSLPDESVDLVVTDPAYESLEKHRAVGTTTRLKHSKASSNDWFTIFPNARFPELFREIHRVMRKDTHFYLFCDQETAFVAKPLGEQAGFKFWKPLVWDKCLAPETPVWTTRGVVQLGDVVEGDEVAVPEGGFARVRATRRTQAPTVRLTLSDGSTLVASRDHRFMLADGTLAEAGDLTTGTTLLTRPVRAETQSHLELEPLVPHGDVVLELPDTSKCLWCGSQFDSSRAAAAHQARFCEHARSKLEMARKLGVSPKRLRRWLSTGRIPAVWAQALGLEGRTTGRVRLLLQNESGRWYPERIPLDHELGKLVGLFAAEGNYSSMGGVSFALHADEKHLRNHISRCVRRVGAKATLVERDGNGCVVNVSFKMVGYLMRAFVGGTRAVDKYFTHLVYAAPREFREGVLAGLIEGDGHWSEHEQRETLNLASLDLTMFAFRTLTELDRSPRVHRFENDHAGGWRLRFDPAKRAEPMRVVAIEAGHTRDLVDISIDHPDELFLLGNGVVTHNCKIGMGYHYRSRYEMILFFEKGKRKLADLSVPDIISEPRIHRGYPTEKPVAVSDVLVMQSAEPGHLVIDPFVGSGSTGVAAVRRGCHFWGNDICAEAVEVARGRLQEAGAEEDTRSAAELAAELGLGLE